MVKCLQCLVFSFSGLKYGVDATIVLRIVWLPALSAVEEAPPYVVGLFLLGERLVPVLDLNLRFGRPLVPYGPLDQVVVVELDGRYLGLIVHKIYDVTSIAPDALEPIPYERWDGSIPAPFATRFAKADLGVVMILDHSELVTAATDMEGASAVTTPSERLQHLFASVDTALLRQRADQYAQTEGRHESGDQAGLVVVSISGEYLAIGAAWVAEITDAVGVTPLPLCPPHIAGLMIRRGEILSLVDLRPVLQLPLLRRPNKVVVIKIGNLLLGVLVEEVLDVIYHDPDRSGIDLTSQKSVAGPFSRGTLRHENMMLNVLDLPALVHSGVLVVEMEMDTR